MINRASRKGDVGYILKLLNYGLDFGLPRCREAMGYAAKEVSDHQHKELKPEEIFELFKEKFEDLKTPFNITEVHFKQHNGIIAEVTVDYRGDTRVAIARRKRTSERCEQCAEKAVPPGIRPGNLSGTCPGAELQLKSNCVCGN